MPSVWTVSQQIPSEHHHGTHRWKISSAIRKTRATSPWHTRHHQSTYLKIPRMQKYPGRGGKNFFCRHDFSSHFATSAAGCEFLRAAIAAACGHACRSQFFSAISSIWRRRARQPAARIFWAVCLLIAGLCCAAERRTCENCVIGVRRPQFRIPGRRTQILIYHWRAHAIAQTDLFFLGSQHKGASYALILYMHDARRSVIYIFYRSLTRSDPTQSACDGRARLIGDTILKQSTQSGAPRGQVLADDFADFVRAPLVLDLHTGNKQKLWVWMCAGRRAVRRWFSRILMELREREKRCASFETGNMPVLKGCQLHIHPWFCRHENCIFQNTQGVWA